MFETIVSIIVGIFVCAGNALISSHPIARITRVEKSSLKIGKRGLYGFFCEN